MYELPLTYNQVNWYWRILSIPVVLTIVTRNTLIAGLTTFLMLLLCAVLILRILHIVQYRR